LASEEMLVISDLPISESDNLQTKHSTKTGQCRFEWVKNHLSWQKSCQYFQF